MAQAMMKDSKITLVFETGMNEKGEAIFKAKSYANVRKEATATQVHQAASALAGLSAYPIVSVERTDNFDIGEPASLFIIREEADRMQELIPLISEVGFPVVVTLYLLRIEAKLDNVVQSIRNLPERMKERA